MDNRDPREDRAEIPLAVASLLFLAAYALLVLSEGLSDVWHGLALGVISAVWLLFALDYAARWRRSGQGPRFVRTHWLDTLVLLLPLLRPLRIVRLYEAVTHRRGRPRFSLQARVMFYAGVSVLLIGFAGALAVYQQERGAPGATIRTFGDSVWWTCSTLATVGYGDVTPVTPVGRTIAVALMACGLALLGAVTGSFASWLMTVFATDEERGRPPGS
ncbi:potassium channel family protein [Streptomyces sp. NPDC056600]|uniref:potassium channel family protein n=1 Tax=Streptomyces sp. NPDC056600 TaxID=3345874 RepID=UPI0036A1B367